MQAAKGIHTARLAHAGIELVLMVGLMPLAIGAAVLATAGGASLPGGCVPGRAEALSWSGPVPDAQWQAATALGGVLPEPMVAPERFLALALETWRFWGLELLAGRVSWSWSCMGLDQLLHRLGGSLLLVGAALGLGLLVALWGLRGLTRDVPSRNASSPWILMVPSVIWAALLTFGVNLLVFRLESSPLGLDPSRYALPGGALELRYGAALLVLLLGGGGLYRLHLGMRTELLRLLEHERIFSARANGLPVGARLFRGMLIPTLALLVSTLPMMLGEVVVVEFIFSLEGIGRELKQLALDRDAPALMTVATSFVLLTRGLHAGVRQLRWWLEPVTREVQQ